jgi:hypothetical protein
VLGLRRICVGSTREAPTRQLLRSYTPRRRLSPRGGAYPTERQLLLLQHVTCGLRLTLRLLQCAVAHLRTPTPCARLPGWLRVPHDREGGGATSSRVPGRRGSENPAFGTAQAQPARVPPPRHQLPSTERDGASTRPCLLARRCACAKLASLRQASCLRIARRARSWRAAARRSSSAPSEAARESLKRDRACHTHAPALSKAMRCIKPLADRPAAHLCSPHAKHVLCVRNGVSSSASPARAPPRPRACCCSHARRVVGAVTSTRSLSASRALLQAWSVSEARAAQPQQPPPVPAT